MIPRPMLHTTIFGSKMKLNSLQYTLADMPDVQVRFFSTVTLVVFMIRKKLISLSLCYYIAIHCIQTLYELVFFQ